MYWTLVEMTNLRPCQRSFGGVCDAPIAAQMVTLEATKNECAGMAGR
jgi:hypothetical protein